MASYLCARNILTSRQNTDLQQQHSFLRGLLGAAPNLNVNENRT
jgi:hypothetical protein